MGDPKKQKKKYESPRFPWRTDALQSELRFLGEYGLRNKRELWRHRTMISKFRGIARSLLGVPQEERVKLEAQLLGRLKRLGILPQDSVLDNVLDMAIEDILERRLQTIIFRKGLAKTVFQARQLITHGHIAVDGKKVFSPSYLVPKDEESEIAYSPSGPLASPDHPLRTLIESEASQMEGGRS